MVILYLVLPTPTRLREDSKYGLSPWAKRELVGLAEFDTTVFGSCTRQVCRLIRKRLFNDERIEGESVVKR